MRREYISSNKPRSERAIRLRWLRKVKRPDLLPKALLKTNADLQKAYADWQKTNADLQKAYADWQKAYADWQKAYEYWWPAIVARHKIECPGCPFDYDKETIIFSKQ